MDGLDFELAPSPVTSDPARADVACFMGFVGLRQGGPGELLDVLLPIDTWEAFEALVAGDRRPLAPSATTSPATPSEPARVCDTALGAAVRSFFALGGRKCYVVRLGDPWPVLTPRAERVQRRAAILPAPAFPSAVDRASWRGVGHLFGLPDVSFLYLPDLFAVDTQPYPAELAPEGEERFLECAARVEPQPLQPLRGLTAPGCDADGFREWSGFVQEVGRFLELSAREVQLLVAIPRPAEPATLASHPSLAGVPSEDRRRRVAQALHRAREAQWTEAARVQTAFVQLTYPWLRTRLSGRLPGGLEAPDGTLCGVLANNALTRGTWRSASHQPVPDATGVDPVLDGAALRRLLPWNESGQPLPAPRVMPERVSVFGPTVTGVRLLSDVTTDDDEAYRPANLNRLLTAIVRAARLVGEEVVFDPNGERLWRRLRDRLEALLTGLWQAGALHGATPAEALEVRCDRSTMTQNDLDAGRVILRLSFVAASPIERITVVLALEEGGQAELLSTQTDAAVSASAHAA